MLRHELHDARQIVPAHRTVQYDEALRMAALRSGLRMKKDALNPPAPKAAPRKKSAPPKKSTMRK
jgi:hypothetical protein